MKFLIDESLPPALCKWLVAQGHEADHVIRLRLNGRPDQDVWAKASQTGATIVTKDKDYWTPPSRFVGVPVLWLGFGNTLNRQLTTEMERSWGNVEAALDRGETLVLLPSPEAP